MFQYQLSPHAFHQEYHLEKTCTQWNHNKNSLDAHIIDMVLSDDHTEYTKENEEYDIVKETMVIRHAVNHFSCLFTTKNKYAEEPPLSEAPTQNKNSQYKLRSQGLVFKK